MADRVPRAVKCRSCERAGLDIEYVDVKIPGPRGGRSHWYCPTCAAAVAGAFRDHCDRERRSSARHDKDDDG